MDKRNPIFDIMKGVALLLMLVGHTAIDQSGFWYNFIYSFHMPLFFILGGFFARSTEEMDLSWQKMLAKDCKRLLLPYVVTSLAILLFTTFRAIIKYDFSIVSNRAWDLFYVTYNSIPCWFLVALFIIRVLFRFLMKLKKWSLLVTILLSGGALVFAHHVTQLPFCVLTALAAMIFYAIGWWYKRYGCPQWFIAICILCWPYTIFYSRLDLYFMRYGIYPLTILGACGGTYVIYWLCYGLYKCLNCGDFYGKICTLFCNGLRWVGTNSLIVLCFHFFDIYCCYVTMFLYGICGIDLPYWPTVLIRDGMVLLLSWIYVTFLRPKIINNVN